jgi:glucokinase
MSPTHTPLALGIDFGGTSIKAGLCEGATVVEQYEPIATANFKGAKPTLDAIAEFVLSVKKQHPELKAIGVGVPGMVDFERGFVHDLTNVPGWDNIPAKEILEKAIGLPVALDNDANAMAYAEWKYGAGRSFRNVIALTLGTGVGGGLILNGQMFRGANFCAGEIGQMSVDWNGRDGYYGNYGALERYVGNQQFAEYAATLYQKAGHQKSAEDCTPKDLAIAAGAGDPVALAAWQDFGTWLGTTLADVVWLLNPEAIVIGGGVAQAGDCLMIPLKARLQQMLSDVLFAHTRILPARFGTEGGIIGNAALALDMAWSSSTSR